MTTRLARCALAAAVVLTTLAGASPASATASFEVDRLAGSDRYDTARAVAVATFPDGAEEAIVATGATYADALAASFLAGNRSAPVLLTPGATLAAATKAALATLETRRVTIVGGTGAVSDAVERELRSTRSTASGGGNLTVSRIGGSDRYASARLLATATGTQVGTVDGTRTAIVARGDGFADALAGGPLAYAGGLPILTTPGSPSTTLHPDAAAALRSLAIEQVLVLGGPSAVSSGTEQQIRDARGAGSITVVRLAGTDRTETAREVADWAVDELGFAADHADIARGDDFADALTGGVHGGEAEAPVLLTVSPRQLAPSTSSGAAAFLKANAATLEDGHVLGGTAAVSESVRQEAESLGQGADETRPRMSAASANATAETVTVTYDEPVTCADSAATRAQLTFQGASPSTPTRVTCNGSRTVQLQFTNVTAGGNLTYTDDRTGADAGDVADAEGNEAASPQTVAVTVTGDTTAPRMTAASANTATKTIAITYSEPVRCAADTATLRQLTYRGATATSIACRGTDTVTVGFPDVTPGASVTYTDDSAAPDPDDVTDLAGNPATSPNAVAVTAGGDTTAPSMTAAVANIQSETVTVSYSENVTCTDDLATRLQFSYAGATPSRPSAVTCSGSTATLTFGNVTAGGALTYTDESSSADSNDVKDVAGNPAPSPQSVTATQTGDATAPALVSATASTTNEQVVAGYSEPVACTDSPGTRAQFSYQGASPNQPTAVSCNGSGTVVLTFADVTATGTLVYTDDDPRGDANDVRDLAGNSATSPDRATTTTSSDVTAPRMTAADANTVAETVTVTYDEAVTCVDSPGTRAQLLYSGASGAPTSITCDGTTRVVLRFADVTGAGTLGYLDDSPSSDANDVRDFAGNQAPSQSQSATSSSDTTRPSMRRAVSNAAEDTVTVTYTEDVTCTDSTLTRQQFSYSAASPTVANAVACDGSGFVTLTFDDVTGVGNLTYRDESPAGDTNDVRDAAGNQATSPQTVTALASSDEVRPTIEAASADATNETVTLTYDEPVTCGTSPSTAAQFSYSGASPSFPTEVECDGTDTVVLTFMSVGASGTVTYTDDDAGNDGNDVRDLNGNQATSPDSEAAETTTDVVRPQMQSAVADLAGDTVTITYSEPVTCGNGVFAAAERFAYSGSSSPTPTAATCDGTEEVVLVFTDVEDGGDLVYTDENPQLDQNDVRDKADPANQAVSPQTITVTATTDVTRPRMASAVVAGDTVTVTYDEPVVCTDGTTTRQQFTFTGAAPQIPIRVTCNGTTTVVLQFDDVVANGALTYTDENPAADGNDVKDTSPAANQAASPQTVPVS